MLFILKSSYINEYYTTTNYFGPQAKMCEIMEQEIKIKSKKHKSV